MEEGPQQTPTEQPQPSLKLSHQKVIQPSQSLIDEMKAAQPVAPTQPQPVEQPVSPEEVAVSSPQQPSTPVSSMYPEPASGFGAPQQPAPQSTDQVPPARTESRHPVAPPSSLYPEATSGIGASVHTPPSTMEASGQEPEWKGPNRIKVIAVRAVASLIILANVINAYDWLLEKHAGYTNWINAVVICVMLVLAVGIFRLHEGDRFIFVVVAVISLVLSCIGLITFYVSTHENIIKVSAYEKVLMRDQLESNLKAVEDNKSLPAKQKQEAIRQTQDAIHNLQGSASELEVKQYLSTGILVITAVGPLIFFTRPSIKEIFN